MSIQNAGTIIREARLKAGLSQEKMSEGICSSLSLSRIENGTAGVSPSTFQALMAHAGSPCEAFPIFANREDFNCFYSLKRARFYLDCWQLNQAYDELTKIENKTFAENKYYYQEWLLLYGKLHFRSGHRDHNYINEILLSALHISRPEIDFSDFRSLLLSQIEIELFIAIAQEALYINNPELCLQICTQISSYLMNSQIAFLEKDILLSEHAIVYAKYLIQNKEYSAALKLLETSKNAMVKLDSCINLHELTFLLGLAKYHVGNTKDALIMFKTAFFSSHSIESCYSTIIKQYLSQNYELILYDESLHLEEIPLVLYEKKQVIDSSHLSDGTYDIFSPSTLTLGSLIHELRIEQNISLQTLSLGLCSKSRLSKIENGTLQPDIVLSKSLLQRLGLSDAVFSFYGSERETMLHELRLKLTFTPSSDVSTRQCYTEELLQLCNENDTFYLQYVSYKRACAISDKEKSAEALFETLHITLPNITANNIQNYCLSWLELTILNNYCNALHYHSPSKGTLELYKLLEYYSSSNIDILEKKRLIGIPICDLSSALYKQKRFSELVELAPYITLPAFKHSLNSLGIFLANYSQALGETQQTKKVPLFATYAYYNLLITDESSVAKSLKNWIFDDFNVTIP